MSRIRKAVNDLVADGRVDYVTRCGSTVKVRDWGSDVPYPLAIEMARDPFNVKGLRELSKLFRRLADQLEAEGRGITE
ncbi:hypothetical protein WK72_14420 [Burkholderia ubonensis]|uniref:hypothetical protein n=1 Tax=Burkholderia ubonensis TaxID=101571 RepID=UPI000758A893|nr:hypothetical protein [Burkholderia ubonensis]KVD68693.1 hypothetical protein WI88_32565 [Burkholderia ubonensis]KVO83292.1 hypothetical protein WJ81_22900 [Burkholderia ubonensis]KVU68914.1 hypothetical protein WK72_14420 [Burkholderia ubonensis]KVZ58938.1 hypothetical protein WL20_20295 [Burkholderia ubonensis]KVZ70567.1 hypothetical protein WL21_09680 [Burkholderia ubonensis]